MTDCVDPAIVERELGVPMTTREIRPVAVQVEEGSLIQATDRAYRASNIRSFEIVDVERCKVDGTFHKQEKQLGHVFVCTLERATPKVRGKAARREDKRRRRLMREQFARTGVIVMGDAC